MAYACSSGACFTSPNLVKTFVPCFRNKTTGVRPQPVTVAHPDRRPIARQVSRSKPATFSMEPQAEYPGQGSKPKLPLHVLKRAVAEEELQYRQLQRAFEETQAQTAKAGATAEKALRVIRKGSQRSREVTSHRRLLQTKVDRASKEADIPQLHATIAGTDKHRVYALEEARLYKGKHDKSKEELKKETKRKEQALAAKEEALREVEELELQRQQELQRYEEAVNTARVFGQFLYELCVKAILVSPLRSAGQAEQGTSKAASKGTARFL